MPDLGLRPSLPICGLNLYVLPSARSPQATETRLGAQATKIGSGSTPSITVCGFVLLCSQFTCALTHRRRWVIAAEMELRFGAILFLGLIAGGCKQAASAKQSVEDAALRKTALSMCGQLGHRSGEACKSDVEKNLPRCSAEFLAKTISSEGFAKCVGFILPEKQPAPIRLWECEAPLIKATVSVSLAKLSYWENSKMHAIKNQTYFVSNSPVVVSSDLRSARLEDFGSQKMLTFELSAEAAKRLESSTEDNVGQYLLITLNGSETVAKLASALSMLPLAAPEIASGEVCAVKAP